MGCRKSKTATACRNTSVTVIHNMDELQELLKRAESKNVILLCSATFCRPCHELLPIFQEYADKYRACPVVSAKVDLDLSDEMMSEFKIFRTPTFLVFVNGEVVYQHCDSTKKHLIHVFKKYSTTVKFTEPTNQ